VFGKYSELRVKPPLSGQPGTLAHLNSRPGLYFTFDGKALDFRGTIATFRNIPLIRTKR